MKPVADMTHEELLQEFEGFGMRLDYVDPKVVASRGTPRMKELLDRIQSLRIETETGSTSAADRPISPDEP